MVRVRVARHLTRHFSIPTELEAAGTTVAEVLADLEQRFPGVASYIVHENGQLRQHVNVFVGEQLVRDRKELSDRVAAGDEVYLMQALSGG